MHARDDRYRLACHSRDIDNVDCRATAVKVKLFTAYTGSTKYDFYRNHKRQMYGMSVRFVFIFHFCRVAGQP